MKKVDQAAKENGIPAKQAEAMKLKKITFHALRNSFTTLSLQQGTDPHTIQEALGHYKVAFTLDVYSGVTAQ